MTYFDYDFYLFFSLACIDFFMSSWTGFFFFTLASKEFRMKKKLNERM